MIALLTADYGGIVQVGLGIEGITTESVVLFILIVNVVTIGNH